MLQQLSPELWTTASLIDLGLMSLTRRMTVAKLPDGSTWIHSPNEASPELCSAVEAIGPVRWLVVPNLFHSGGAESWKRAFPDARLVGPRGLGKKKPALPLDAELSEEAPEGWGAAIEIQQAEGVPLLNELFFFHVTSRTLLLTDFVFNQGEASGLPAFSKLMLRMMQAYGRLGPSRLFRLGAKDMPAVARSVRRACERWPVERLSACHGEVLEERAAERLVAAFADW